MPHFDDEIARIESEDASLLEGTFKALKTEFEGQHLRFVRFRDADFLKRVPHKSDYSRVSALCIPDADEIGEIWVEAGRICFQALTVEVGDFEAVDINSFAGRFRDLASNYVLGLKRGVRLNGSSHWDANQRPTADAPPAVKISRSITPEYLVCLEDGERFRSIGRHLLFVHGLTPSAYRERWALPRDYPMISPNYALARHKFLKQAIGAKQP